MTIGLICLGAILIPSIALTVWVNWRLWWCQWKHKKHHQVRPTFYGSGYAYDCSKCKQTFMGYRN